MINDQLFFCESITEVGIRNRINNVGTTARHVFRENVRNHAENRRGVNFGTQKSQNLMKREALTSLRPGSAYSASSA